ncbi:MAG TPA: hypothetical protein VMW41_06300 [Candidatus Bathyarchaeia archaeon]|nr:hypothetical protein [Candidatus Bathyarchaeia archaeon]
MKGSKPVRPTKNFMENKYKIIGCIGVWLSICLFFMACLLEDRIENSPFVLIYPFFLLSAFFFVGVATGGTIKNGLKQALNFIFILLFAILCGLVLRFFKTK